MILGIVMLYVLNVLDAPVWCYVLCWFHIVLSAISFLIRYAETVRRRSRNGGTD